jgi:hypothetical protein
MKQELWDTIVGFDLDRPAGEYSFSKRLAYENCWTTSFTSQAILEYKKFMYLAATYEFMVSPSEIVDQVWHLHLIFTESYSEFCQLLGKQVQHIPSTHNKEDYLRFKQAKERTKEYYEKEFGTQPESIWGQHDLFDSLIDEKSNYDIRKVTNFGILAFICFSPISYLLLKDIYKGIQGTNFIVGIIAVTLVTLGLLEIFNRFRLRKIVAQIEPSSFIFDLSPSELIFAKTQSLEKVIIGELNELIEAGVIKVNTNKTIEHQKTETEVELNEAQMRIVEKLDELGPLTYDQLMRNVSIKPQYRNIETSINAIWKNFTTSKKYGRLYAINFSLISIIVLLSLTRVIAGYMNDKPIGYIVLTTILLIVAMSKFLERLSKQICTHAIPSYYEDVLIESRNIEVKGQWRYFLFSSKILSSALVPIITVVNYSANSGAGTNIGGGGGCGGGCGGCGG